jgi:hypothetical protein
MRPAPQSSQAGMPECRNGRNSRNAGPARTFLDYQIGIPEFRNSEFAETERPEAEAVRLPFLCHSGRSASGPQPRNSGQWFRQHVPTPFRLDSEHSTFHRHLLGPLHSAATTASSRPFARAAAGPEPVCRRFSVPQLHTAPLVASFPRRRGSSAQYRAPGRQRPRRRWSPAPSAPVDISSPQGSPGRLPGLSSPCGAQLPCKGSAPRLGLSSPFRAHLPLRGSAPRSGLSSPAGAQLPLRSSAPHAASSNGGMAAGVAPAGCACLVQAGDHAVAQAGGWARRTCPDQCAAAGRARTRLGLRARVAGDHHWCTCSGA